MVVLSSTTVLYGLESIKHWSIFHRDIPKREGKGNMGTHGLESNPQQTRRNDIVIAGLDKLGEPVPQLFDDAMLRQTCARIVEVSFPPLAKKK